jgi:hypothetical protein
MYTTVGTYYSFYMIVCCAGWIGFQSNQLILVLCAKVDFVL